MAAPSIVRDPIFSTELPSSRSQYNYSDSSHQTCILGRMARKVNHQLPLTTHWPLKLSTVGVLCSGEVFGIKRLLTSLPPLTRCQQDSPPSLPCYSENPNHLRLSKCPVGDKITPRARNPRPPLASREAGK
jgi:hypothetical protein